MNNAAFITFTVIFALEAVVIIIGNTFTIFFFWYKRFYLRRASFLLINLAIADLLVGIVEPVVLAAEKIPKVISSVSFSISTIGSCASVFFLALISLERVFAVLRPLRHRVIRTRVYIYSVIVVWALGICSAAMFMFAIYYIKVNRLFFMMPISAFIFISLLVICASYLAIRTRLHNITPVLESHHSHSTERNLRLSRTFFLVVALSLVLWLPAVVVYRTEEFCPLCISTTVRSIIKGLHLANSMVNPLVYSFKMPIFRDALQRSCRKLQHKIESRRFDFWRPDLWTKRGAFTLQNEMDHTFNTSTYNSKEVIRLVMFKTDNGV